MDAGLFKDTFLPITLAVITFGLGLSITFKDIRNVVYLPRNIGVGLFSQLIILPILAFSIAFLTPLKEELAVGLVLIAICPGGATSNLVTFLIRGNVALSVSMTVVNSLITVFTIPLMTMLAMYVFLGQDSEPLPLLESVLKIVMLTVLPATSGVIVRRYFENLSARLEEPLRYILPILLLLVYSGVLFLEKGDGGISFQDFLKIIPYALVLNLIAMTAGFYIPGFFGIRKRNQATIAVEVGLQNSTLAIYVAGSLLNNNTIAMVAVVYGSFSFFTTWGFGYLARKYL